jgi:hypothetical protein
MWFAANGTIEPFERLEAFLLGKAGAENGFVGEMLSFDVDQLALVDREGQNTLDLARTSHDAKIADILARHLEQLTEATTATIERLRSGDVTDHELARLLNHAEQYIHAEAARRDQLIDGLLKKHEEIRRAAARAMNSPQPASL